MSDRWQAGEDWIIASRNPSRDPMVTRGVSGIWRV